MIDGFIFITPLYAAFFGVMLVVLSWRVTKLRLKHDNHMRDHGHNELTAAVRAQANIVEYLPIALLLMWMLETMQFAPALIHGLGLFLIFARLLHLHGLHEPSGAGAGRKIGTRLTWLHIVVCSLLAFAGCFGISIQ